MPRWAAQRVDDLLSGKQAINAGQGDVDRGQCCWPRALAEWRRGIEAEPPEPAVGVRRRCASDLHAFKETGVDERLGDDSLRIGKDGDVVLPRCREEVDELGVVHPHDGLQAMRCRVDLREWTTVERLHDAVDALRYFEPANHRSRVDVELRIVGPVVVVGDNRHSLAGHGADCRSSARRRATGLGGERPPALLCRHAAAESA
jgi:hypothetical protein